MKYLLIWLLRGYRFAISPLYGQVCRYHPSCSAYALQAVTTHGSVKGSWLAVRRLARCHPWAPGGYDPVPGTPAYEALAKDRAVSSEADLVTADLPAVAADLSSSSTTGSTGHRVV